MSTKKSNDLTRRRLMQKTAAAASFVILPSKQIRGTEANSRIKVGCIGLGGRGRMIANFFKEHGGYEIHAACVNGGVEL